LDLSVIICFKMNTLPDQGGLYPDGPPELRILGCTYDHLGPLAVDLYAKLRNNIGQSLESLDFGPTCLDVGARDGRYVPVMRELGVTNVVAIDPSGEDLDKGVAEGILDESGVYKGPLEAWVETAPEPADSAFVLNMSPRLPRSRDFVSALMRAVKPGGLVVTSFVEWSTYSQFTSPYSRGELVPINQPRTTGTLADMDTSAFEAEIRQPRVNGWLSIARRSRDAS
jgi:2-polyprenyl-3-methyl-5-hydroxy-6-metoxy-1,4-benzoquinol methylase